MAKDNPIRVVDAAILRAERRLDSLRALRDAAASDPNLLTELVREFAGSRNGAHKPTPKNTGKETVVEKIKTYLLQQNNEWQTAPKIISDTGLSRGVVSFALYKDDSPFEKKPHPKSKKLKLWRVRKEVTP